MILKKLSPSDIGETGQRAVNLPKEKADLLAISNFFDAKNLESTSVLPNRDYKLSFIERHSLEQNDVILSYKPGSNQWRIIGLSNNKEYFKRNDVSSGDFLLIHKSNKLGNLLFEVQKAPFNNDFVDFLLIHYYLVENKTFREIDKILYEIDNQNGSKSNKQLKNKFNITDVKKKSFFENGFEKEYLLSKEDNLYQAALNLMKKYNPNISLMSSNKIFNIDNFQKECKYSGLIYNSTLISRFVSSLLTKPFVILNGLSGSGKTKLAQAFVQWISENEKQYKIIPVGADWTNREPLLGYPNGLDSNSYVMPDSGALQLILDASKDNIKPYFLILDEMNLSHVERYFADFLSIMESGDSIKLYSGSERIDSRGNKIDQEIFWPENLFVIGTVNIDETTYMFSPKVLDRANVIEFRITVTEMKEFFKEPKKLDMKKLFRNENKNSGGSGQNMGEGFLLEAQKKTITKIAAIKGEDSVLNKFFTELQKVGAEFGYRSATEIELLITKLSNGGFVDDENNPLNDDTKIDIAIMQKLLPKLHGSRSKLNTILTTLAKFCVKEAMKDFEGKDEDFRKKYFIPFDTLPTDLLENIKYKISFEKISRMHKNAIDNGFTSYAEA